MKKIIITKTLAYDPTFGGMYSRYEGYAKITMRQASPHLLSDVLIPILHEQLSSPIVSSSLERAYETAVRIGDQHNIKNLKKTTLLNEVTFNLRSLVTEEEFIKEGSRYVRKQFVQAFINDTLFETREHIHTRIVTLLSSLKELHSGTYLLISHSFFMKILEIYLTNTTLFSDPFSLQKCFDTQKKTYEFGEGFTFNL